jgi:hypothetical protein
MTLERITLKNDRLLERCACIDLYEIGEVPCLYSPVAPEIEAPCSKLQGIFDRKER